MAPYLVTFAILLSAAGEARVEVLDGPEIVGEFVAMDGDGVLVRADGNDVAIPNARLNRVVRTNAETGATEAPWIELRGGSVIPILDISVGGDTASVRLRDETSPIEVPIEAISVVRLKPPTKEIDAQWSDIRQANSAADVLVIRRESSVDYLEGVVKDVDSESTTFELDGDPVPVPRSKIDGWIYFRGTAPELPESRCEVRTRSGMRLTAKAAISSDDALHVVTLEGVRVTLPITDVSIIDFSANKLKYLGELERVASSVTPYIESPDAAEFVTRTGGPLFDRGFFSPHLEIRSPVEPSGGKRWSVKSFNRGVAVRSRTEMVYRVPKGFRRLRAVAGIDAALSGRGVVQLVVSADGDVLFDQVIRGNEAPVDLNIDIENKKRLTILVDFGGDGDAGDRLYLCDARVTK